MATLTNLRTTRVINPFLVPRPVQGRRVGSSTATPPQSDTFYLVGDRVICRKDYGTDRVGKEGTIMSLEGGTAIVRFASDTLSGSLDFTFPNRLREGQPHPYEYLERHESCAPLPAQQAQVTSPDLPSDAWGFLTTDDGATKPIAKAKAKPAGPTFASVVLAAEKKEAIKAAISQLHHTKQIFDEWGFGETMEKGTAVTLLFYGGPGTGKTLMAEAIATDLGADFKLYGNAEIGSSEPGGSERMIKEIFAEAKKFFTVKKKPRVILFDECDALLYDRNKVGVILGAQINALLSEIERHEGVIIFTTNRLQVLDAALERRISAKIEFPFPDKTQRAAIWQRMIPPKAPLGKDVSFQKLAKFQIAGGNIKNAVLNAARMAAYKESKTITLAHFAKAAAKEVESIAAFTKPSSNFHTEPITALREDIGVGESRKLTIANQTDAFKDYLEGVKKT